MCDLARRRLFSSITAAAPATIAASKVPLCSTLAGKTKLSDNARRKPIAGKTIALPVFRNKARRRKAIKGPNTICGWPGKEIPRLLNTSAGRSPTDLRMGLIVTAISVTTTIQITSSRRMLVIGVASRQIGKIERQP